MGKFSCFQENKIPHFGKKWEYRGQDFGASLPFLGKFGKNSEETAKIAPKFDHVLTGGCATANWFRFESSPK